jgi:uncharacterized iron-regulated membrane protein
VRRIVRQVHLYAGLALCLLLFIFAVTGGALVYKEAYWRLVYPELRSAAPAPALTARDHAAAVAFVRAQFGTAITSIKLPEPGVSAYHVYLDGREAFVSMQDYHIIDEWRPRDRLMAWLFDLHAHLMAGEAGEKVGGVIALLGSMLAGTGLILWWPSRRRFSLKHLLPGALSRRTLLLWHRDLGALASPILLLVLLSGSGIVFYTTAERILNGMFGDAVPAATPRAPITGPVASAVDADMFRQVESLFPGGRIVFYYPPTATSATHGFRVKQPCELHPNGRSYAYLSVSGAVLQHTDACALPPGERAVHALYPLHSGKTDSSVYKMLVLFSAVALAVLSVSGAAAYVKGLLRTSARSRQLA